MKLSIAIFSIVTLAFTMPASADVIYGDIAGGNQPFSGYGLGPGGGTNNYIAEGFTMTSSYNLQSVDVSSRNFKPILVPTLPYRFSATVVAFPAAISTICQPTSTFHSPARTQP